MGASGADLLLSPAARKLFPFYTECKNVESLNIWAALKQAEAGATKAANATDPVVVFSRNNADTYVALPFSVLISLLKETAYLG
jgi:hypothetical protein